MKKAYFFVPLTIIVVLIVLAVVLYLKNYVPHKKYTNADFAIEDYKSSVDKDGDGVDDQTDILNGVKAYLETNPVYQSKYYESGYPDDEYGVCTDVVLQGLLAAGYDYMELMSEDIEKHKSEYNIDKPDKNIDFRRVVNMKIYLDRHAISLTTDMYDIGEWQAGDIVVFEHHVGIISENRNAKGIPFVYHHTSKQASYEEDIMELRGKILGHYRIS